MHIGDRYLLLHIVNILMSVSAVSILHAIISVVYKINLFSFMYNSSIFVFNYMLTVNNFTDQCQANLPYVCKYFPLTAFSCVQVYDKKNASTMKNAQYWSQEGMSPYKTSKLLMTFSRTNFLLCGTAHKTRLFCTIKG